MSESLLEARPEAETSESVYSNFDHELDEKVVAELEADPGLCARHAAWDFCGYVWRSQDGVWHDQVWRFNAPVEQFNGDSAREVIEAANDEYGNGRHDGE